MSSKERFPSKTRCDFAIFEIWLKTCWQICGMLSCVRLLETLNPKP